MFTFLPDSIKAEVSSEYRRRLLAIIFGLTALGALAGAALSMPAFVTLWNKDQAALMGAKGASTPDAAEISTLDARVKDILAKSAAVQTEGSQKTLVSELGALTERLTPGISLSSIALKRGDTGTIVITGTAATRDDMVAFSKSLQSEPSFSGVSLPISTLAKSKDIDFSISIDSKF